MISLHYEGWGSKYDIVRKNLHFFLDISDNLPPSLGPEKNLSQAIAIPSNRIWLLWTIQNCYPTIYIELRNAEVNVRKGVKSDSYQFIKPRSSRYHTVLKRQTLLLHRYDAISHRTKSLTRPDDSLIS